MNFMWLSIVSLYMTFYTALSEVMLFLHLTTNSHICVPVVFPKCWSKEKCITQACYSLKPQPDSTVTCQIDVNSSSCLLHKLLCTVLPLPRSAYAFFVTGDVYIDTFHHPLIYTLLNFFCSSTFCSLFLSSSPFLFPQPQYGSCNQHSFSLAIHCWDICAFCFCLLTFIHKLSVMEVLFAKVIGTTSSHFDPSILVSLYFMLNHSLGSIMHHKKILNFSKQM